MMPDHVADLVVPRLLKGITKEAPQVRLDLTPWRGPATINEDLARSIDLLIACVERDLAGFDRQSLFSDTEAIAVRRGHPAGRRLGKLSAFLKARHVAVVGRGQTEDPVDGWLREEGIERRIALVVPTYLQALHIAARSDLVAFVPRRLIEALASPLRLLTVRPPVDPGTYEEFMFHPSRARNDPGSLWLRDHLLRIGRSLG
jgi:DNA-binding transcriptional LysR family regulator